VSHDRRRDGKQVVNRRGLPWSKFAVCNRMYRLSQKLGKRLIFYGSRHGFATKKLLQGRGHLTIAQLLGHTDGSMISKVYGHLDKNVDFLNEALVD
jgi:integrase